MLMIVPGRPRVCGQPVDGRIAFGGTVAGVVDQRFRQIAQKGRQRIPQRGIAAIQLPVIARIEQEGDLAGRFVGGKRGTPGLRVRSAQAASGGVWPAPVAWSQPAARSRNRSGRTIGVILCSLLRC